MGKGQKHIQLSAWKRLLLIAGMFLLGESLIVLVPSQTVSAQTSRSQPPFICWAGNGGNGGIATNRSSGASGAAGGDCVNGPRGGDAGSGGEVGSPWDMFSVPLNFLDGCSRQMHVHSSRAVQPSHLSNSRWHS